MKWILLVLGLMGCAGGFVETTRIRGTDSDRLELRVVNTNWTRATIRIMGPEGKTFIKRVGSVEGLSRKNFMLRYWYIGGARLFVEFLANASPEWLDEQIHYEGKDCIELRIISYSPGSYTLPCFNN